MSTHAHTTHLYPCVMHFMHLSTLYQPSSAFASFDHRWQPVHKNAICVAMVMTRPAS